MQRAGLHILLQAMGQAVLHNLLKCVCLHRSSVTPQRISPETHVSDIFDKITPETHLSDTPHKNIPETHTTEILQRHIVDLLPRESLQRLMSKIFSTKSLQRHTSVTHPIKTFQRRTPQTFCRDTSLTYLLFVCSHFGLRASPQSGLRHASVLSDLQWRSERGSEQGCTCCCKQCIKQC